MTFVKLINYTSAAMVALTIVALAWEGSLMFDKLLNVPWGWAPALAGLVLIAVGLYDWSRKWITRHEGSQNVAIRVQTVPEGERMESNDN